MTAEEQQDSLALPKRKDSTKLLSDFHIGEKFIDWQGFVQILLMYNADPITNQLEYATKEWKTGVIRKHSSAGLGIFELRFYPYKGRDKISFYAGFRFALNLCMKHMTTEEKLNAGIYRFGDDHLKMLDAYEGWKQNNVSYYDRKYINYQKDKRKVRRDAKSGKFLLVP
jgi:hypothetical protein